MSNLVKPWHLKFDQKLDESLMALNVLLFRRINALRKVTEEVQIWTTIAKTKKSYPCKEILVPHGKYILLLHLISTSKIDIPRLSIYSYSSYMLINLYTETCVH
jgi:hypothetical protein